MRKRMFVVGLLASIAASVAAVGAAADTGLVTGTLAAGTLSESTSATPTFSVTLNGTDQTANYTLPITLIDSRGSGAGWNLTVTSTQFSTGGGSPNTLPTSASTITGVASICNAGSSCTNPTNAVSYPLGLPAGSTPPTAAKFFNAAANTGMGKFTITPTVQVSVPANAFAGTYTSTVTLAVVSGP
jgi:putative surface cell wall-binding protein